LSDEIVAAERERESIASQGRKGRGGLSRSVCLQRARVGRFMSQELLAVCSRERKEGRKKVRSSHAGFDPCTDQHTDKDRHVDRE